MDVLVNADVDNVRLTNDIDLADLASKAFYLDQTITTSSKWSINQAIVGGRHFLQPVEADINNQPFNIGQLIGKNDSITNESIQVNYLIYFILYMLQYIYKYIYVTNILSSRWKSASCWNEQNNGTKLYVIAT